MSLQIGVVDQFIHQAAVPQRLFLD